MSWTRRLDPNWTPNPVWVGDGDPDYRIRIEHVIPMPLPAGVTQFWQVIKCTVLTIDKDCKLEIKTKHLLDISTIGGRATIPDLLSLRYTGDYCLVWEACEHTVGFDDKTSNYRQYSSKLITENLANRLKGSMTGPTTSFKTNYVYSKGDCCPELIAFFTFGWRLPAGEWLNVEGVGQYPPPPPPPPGSSGTAPDGANEGSEDAPDGANEGSEDAPGGANEGSEDAPGGANEGSEDAPGGTEEKH